MATLQARNKAAEETRRRIALRHHNNRLQTLKSDIQSMTTSHAITRSTIHCELEGQRLSKMVLLRNAVQMQSDWAEAWRQVYHSVDVMMEELGGYGRGRIEGDVELRGFERMVQWWKGRIREFLRDV